MSSTITTSRPARSRSRSCRMLHPPGVGREARDRDEVDLDVDRRGSRGRGRRGRSSAPLSTPTSTTPSGWSAAISAPSRATRAATIVGVVEQDLGVGAARRLAHSASVSRTASRQQRGAQLAAERRPARRAPPAARARASGLRWRTYGSSTWPNSTASRSANVRYMRRWRASMPCAKKPGGDPRDLERVVVERTRSPSISRRASTQAVALELARPARRRAPAAAASSARV